MNEAIYNALCACFGLSPSSADASVLIREAYQDPENAPRLPRSVDVIYYTIEPDVASEEAPPEYGAVNPTQAAHTPTVSRYAAWVLHLICYGPHALQNARKIRAFLYIDGANMPRCILRKVGIRPIPDPPEPLLLHEPEGSLWRLRCDLTVQLRTEEAMQHSARRNAVASAPAIILYGNT